MKKTKALKYATERYTWPNTQLVAMRAYEAGYSAALRDAKKAGKKGGKK